MTARSRSSRLLLTAAALLSVGIVGAVAPGPGAEPTVSADSGSLGAGGEFHALTPARIFDSRPASVVNDPAPGAKVTSTSTPSFKIHVVGMGGLPSDPSDILAIVANVTVVQPTAGGWLGVLPTGAPAGTSSIVNFAPGRDVPNLAYVGVGSDGSITARMFSNQTGRAHVVVDVFGWISTSSSGSRGTRLIATGPERLLDTRENRAPLGVDGRVALPILGASASVPNDGSIKAVVINIGAVNDYAGSRETYVSATPTASPKGQQSKTSNINVAPGQIKTSMAVVPLGPDGKIHFRNNTGSMHLVVDVFGYFKEIPDDSRVGRIVPLRAPFRALDTRTAAFGRSPLGTGSVEDWSFKNFANSVSMASGDGLGKQSALIGNLTGTGLGRVYPTVFPWTYLTAYPGNVRKPFISNLNLVEGEDVANMSLLRYGTVGNDPNVIKMYNNYGSLHYVLDVYAVVLAD